MSVPCLEECRYIERDPSVLGDPYITIHDRLHEETLLGCRLPKASYNELTLKTWVRIGHPYFHRIRCVVDGPPDVLVIMEPFPDCALMSETWSGRLSLKQAGRLLLQLVDAFEFLHEQELSSLGLCLDNLYLREGDICILGHERLCPLGQWQIMDTGSLDLRFTPPELLQDGHVNEKSGIYQLGSMMRFYLCGKFQDPQKCPDHLERLLTVLDTMIQPKAALRPSWSEVRTALTDLNLESDLILIEQLSTSAREALSKSLEDLERGPQMRGLRLYRSEQGRSRLQSFVYQARHGGYLVLHTWGREGARDYGTINDLISLLKMGVLPYLRQEALAASIKPMSQWQTGEEQRRFWRELLGTLVPQLLPQHAKGMVFVVEHMDLVDEPSVRVLRKLAGMLKDWPFLLVLSGEHFVDSSFEGFEEHLETAFLSFTMGHANFRGLNENHRLPLEQVLLETASEEVRTISWLRQQERASMDFDDLLEREWTSLGARGHLLMDIFACSHRPLDEKEVAVLSGRRDLDALLVQLKRMGWIEAQGSGLSIGFRALRRFCLERISSQEGEEVRRRLVDYEQALDKPDRVQIVALLGRGGSPDVLREITQALKFDIMERGDFETLWRLDAWKDGDGSLGPDLEPLRSFADLLRGLTVRSERVRGWRDLENWNKANRLRAKDPKQALKNFLLFVQRRRHVPHAVQVHALVLASEVALEAEDYLVLGKIWRIYRELGEPPVPDSVLSEWEARLGAAQLAGGREIDSLAASILERSDVYTAYYLGNRDYFSGTYETACSYFERAVEKLNEHHDLNFKGHLYKELGNALCRCERSEEGAKAYAEAERCFSQTKNVWGLSAIRFNHAVAELTSGRLGEARRRFEGILEEETDREYASQVRYYLMACDLFHFHFEAFEEKRRLYMAASRRLRGYDYSFRGLLLYLQAAFWHEKDDLQEALRALERTMEKHEVDLQPMLRAEADFAIRIARFALGRPEHRPDKPYAPTTHWRHEFLDFLQGRSELSFAALMEQIGSGYFYTCHRFILATAINAGMLPSTLFCSNLVSHFEKAVAEGGHHFIPFLRKHFTHLREKVEIDPGAWSAAVRTFEKLSFPCDERGMTTLLEDIQSHHPFDDWGIITLKDGTWTSLPNWGVNAPEAVQDYLLQRDGDALLDPMNYGAVDENGHLSFWLLLPLGFKRHRLAWFHLLKGGGEESLLEPLMRFYGQLMYWIVQSVSVEEQSMENLPTMGMVGSSKAMQLVKHKIAAYGPSDLSVYVWGESGTGKELVARALHQVSKRSTAPFCPINCSHFPDNLVESELFGHVKGAFTGANEDRMGLLERANGGTVFLDEVGDLSEKVQSLLLRVIQEGEVQRIGDHTIRKVDLRFVVATNKNLHTMIDRGEFREDLYFRLVDEELRLPALRHRLDDLPSLMHHFVHLFDPTRQVRFNQSFMDKLLKHSWPGNIRELRGYVQKLLVRWPDLKTFNYNHVMPFLRERNLAIDNANEQSLEEILENVKLKTIEERLTLFGGNRSKTAASLGMSRQGLIRFIQRNGLT